MPKPLAKLYRAVITLEDSEHWTHTNTNKRNTIRWCRKSTRKEPRASGNVYAITYHDQISGTYFGPLLYQCHSDDNGKLHTDEL